ncbi:carbon-nitrogen hydrolase family protein [Burkholderia gladioli]|uniref:carbon-nitrogen hydrolase family protein n=1 Tax=Burkholderia gladioli TaxID=28095 RepID=UPI000F51C978|nr:carbon-nitrogen hydrolase family protein [Burkholderia gladioli]MBU9277787.1 carbon-nitrogen hydrolase family protein [Burkholderia gladioli]
MQTGTVRILYVQWPDGLQPSGAAWEAIRRAVDAEQADLLVTNEMPFGPWLAITPDYDAEAAARSVALHEEALAALGQLQVGAVLSSRPVAQARRLANEAFVIEGGAYRYLHHKKFFPEEPGWHEASWFERGREGFECATVGKLKLGVLLCTELFFNEHARAYGRLGADLIVTPRATGHAVQHWFTAGAMAAIVAGAALVSSNRHGRATPTLEFGGTGFAMSPTGESLGTTSRAAPLRAITLDLAATRAAKLAYPCYVKE